MIPGPKRRWLRFSLRTLKLPRFQFTIRHMMIATFWAGVTFGGVVANQSIGAWEIRDQQTWAIRRDRVLLKESLMCGTAYAIAVSLFIAVGALFGRPRTGALVGLAVTSATMLNAALFMFFEADRDSAIVTAVEGSLGIVVVAALILVRRWKACRAGQAGSHP